MISALRAFIGATLVVGCLGFSTFAEAQNSYGGYRSDGMGGLTGYGDLRGRGYRSDGLGGLRGTGDNRGGGWRSDGLGGLRGTGTNRGGGWRPDGLGGIRGTGDNFGTNCTRIGTQVRCR